MNEDKKAEGFYLNKLPVDAFEIAYNNANFSNLPIQPEVFTGRILATKKDQIAVRASISPELGRGATLPGPVLFQNSDGEKFFYIDTKGIGNYLLAKNSISPFDVDEKWFNLERRIEGAVFLSGALWDSNNTKRLVDLGVRVPQFISIFTLSPKVFPPHVQVKMSELNEEGCIVFRAFKNPNRIGGFQDLLLNETLLKRLPKEKSLAIYIKATDLIQNTISNLKMENVWQDYGGKNENEDYLLNFSRLLGQSIGRMQKGRYIHRSSRNIGGMVHFYNVTLAAEIVDHDTGIFLKGKLSDLNKALFVNQYMLALRNLSVLCNSLEVFNREDLSDSFLSTVSLEFRNAFLGQISEGDREWFTETLLTGLTQPGENWVWYIEPDTQKSDYPPIFKNRQEFMINFIGHIFLHEQEKFLTSSK